MHSEEIIIDPKAPIEATPIKQKGLILKASSSKERSKLVGQPVGPKVINRTNQSVLINQSVEINKILSTNQPLPCETIIFDLGVKLSDAGQIVNIEDVKSWELINNKDTNYLGSGSLNIGEIEHDPKKSNLLLRGHDNDKVISESTTYINTAVKSDTIVNIAFRDSMPRSIAPVYDNESDSYILSILKKKLGNKFRKNCLYIVKTNVFRASDAIAAQRLYEYIESVGKDNSISKAALKEAALIRKRVHELVCNRKGVDPADVNKLSCEYPYTDSTLGIVHAIYSVPLTNVPGYNHDDGSLFITNLDICINIGLHQAPPLHPTRIAYNNRLSYNPGYIAKCTPQVFTGYAYYVKDLLNQKNVYAIVGGEVVTIEPQIYPIGIDSNNEVIDQDIIRVFKHDKQIIDVTDSNSQLLIPILEDITVEQALKSNMIYSTYQDAKMHLEKFGTSISVDLSKAKSELVQYENKSKELIQLNELADKKHKSLLQEIEATNEQLVVKKRLLEIEYEGKVSTEQEKRDTLKVQTTNDVILHEKKLEAAQISAQADKSSGVLKVLAASVGAAAAGITLVKAYGK
jgi:hypothetical protein